MNQFGCTLVPWVTVLLLSLHLLMRNPGGGQAVVAGQKRAAGPAAKLVVSEFVPFILQSAYFASTNVTFDGHNFHIMFPRKDVYIREPLVKGHLWEERLLLRLCEYIPEGSTVIDVGANIGNHVLAFSRAVGPSGKVVAFEPQQLCVQVIGANLVLNDILNTEVHHAALAHMRGRTTLQGSVPDGSDGAFQQLLRESIANRSNINFGGVAIGTGGEEVPVYTLDEFNVRNVSLLKIDAEGAQVLVAYGARETVLTNLPVILYEHRTDKVLTADIVAAMGGAVPEEVLGFKFLEFVKSLGYKLALPPGAGRGDLLLLPPDVKELPLHVLGQPRDLDW